MNISKLFRLSLVTYILLAIGAVIVQFNSHSLLPQVLQDYLNAQAQENASFPQSIITVLAILLLIILIVSLVGLFRWKSWGRTLFLGSTIIAYCIVPFTGPHVCSGIDYLFHDLGSALNGGIIALAYFSSVAQRFEKHATS